MRAAPTAATRAAVTAAAAPKLSKDELRAQVEKLERSNAALRTKNREAGRAAKAAALRIEALEAQLEKLETAAARGRGSARLAPKPEPARRTGRQAPERDPGDGVPPGVAVQDPEPMDAEAETAFENLKQHLK